MEKFKELLQGEIPLLVDFYASWCGPCKTMHPIVEQVKSMLGDKVRVVKYDVDEHENIASLYHVRMIPTLILFKKGKVIWQHSGVMRAQELFQAVMGAI